MTDITSDITSETDWPFEDPPNLAVISLRSICSRQKPILLVTHDEEDGFWQFLDGDDPVEADAVVIALHRVLSLDPTIAELADLPLGWHAWRQDATSDWQRVPYESVDDA